MNNRVKICWLGKKYKKQFVCFIPFTIDGVGKTADKALQNLESEATKIIKAIRKSKIKCNFTLDMVKEAVRKQSWWRHQKSQCGKDQYGFGGRPRKTHK